MRHFLCFTFFCLILGACEKEIPKNPDDYDCSLGFPDSSARHPKAAKFEALLQEVVRSGVPGIMMSVHTPHEGLWIGAAGMADLSTGVAMRPCSRTRAGSTVKTFTAVTVLKLVEEGKIGLEDTAARYLPASVIEGIENADRSTIRQLLQHSSGIYNYIQNPKFQTASLNDLVKEWSAQELLSYARYKKAYFDPGRDVRYSNTGYILLGMVIERVCGKPFWTVFEEKIFRPLSLSHTLFAATNKVPKDIVRGYVDLHANLRLRDATYYSGWDYYTADGGLISNSFDLATFLRTLNAGKLLQPATLQQMFETRSPQKQDPDFFAMGYGLGVFKIQTRWGAAYIHSGDAIGYYATMLYFPDRQATVSWAVNGNYGKTDAFTSSKGAMEKVFAALFD